MAKTHVTDVPYMIAMWDYEQNTVDPGTVSPSSTESFIWTCRKCGYSRPRPAKTIYKGSGKCPCCETNKVICPGINDVLTKVKDFDKFYDFDNNTGFDITTVGVDCGQQVNFLCPECRRSWSATVKAQIRKLPDGTYEAVGCPHYNTVKRKKADIPFLVDIPKFMRFFDFERNTIDPNTTKSNSPISVALKCNKCGYAWDTDLISFIRGKMQCRCCELNWVVKNGVNDLLTLVPEAKSFLLPEENPEIDIYNLSPRDKRIVNWHCPKCGRKWSSSVTGRVSGKHGTYTLKRCQNCYTTDKTRITPISDIPWVLKFYDIKRNEKAPSEVSVHSKKPVFFKCPDCGFSWKVSPKSRYAIKNDACPCCDSGKYVQTGKTDVLTLCSDIATILDKEKNPGLDLSKEAINSSKEYVFSCKKCGYEWSDTIRNRTKKKPDGSYIFHDCPKCSNKALRSVTYDVQYPDLAKLYDKNANQRPLSSITSYESNSLLLKWICPICNEQFESRLQSMIVAQDTSTKGCPYCSHTKLRPGESFGDLHPELLDEYDESNEIDPFTVFPNSTDSVKWICRNDSSHRWEATFALRHKGSGKCKICYRTEVFPEINSFAAVFPDFVKYWSPNNERRADDVFYNSTLWVRWRCFDCNGEYGALIADRVSEDFVCPYCSDRLVLDGFNSVSYKYPELTHKWASDNDTAITNVIYTAKRIIKWICDDCGGEYTAPLQDMINDMAPCPYCEGRRAIPGETSLAALYTNIAKLYSSKNKKDADHVLPTVLTSYVWECDVCGQEFSSTPKEMVEGTYDCPYCNGRLVLPGKTSFKAKHPDLMDEWDTLANYCLGIDPDTILDTCGTKVWWVCPRDKTHRYEMKPSERLFYQKRHREPCCYCKGRRRKKIFNNI